MTDRDDDWVVQKVLGGVRNLQTAIDVPYRLCDVDIDRDNMTAMVEIVTGYSAIASNSRGLTKVDIKNTLESAWRGLRRRIDATVLVLRSR